MSFLSCIFKLLKFFFECTSAISANSSYHLYGHKGDDLPLLHLTCRYNVLWSKRDNSSLNIKQNTSISTKCEMPANYIFFFHLTYSSDEKYHLSACSGIVFIIFPCLPRPFCFTDRENKHIHPGKPRNGAELEITIIYMM